MWLKANVLLSWARTLTNDNHSRTNLFFRDVSMVTLDVSVVFSSCATVKTLVTDLRKRQAASEAFSSVGEGLRWATRSVSSVSSVCKCVCVCVCVLAADSSPFD